MVKNWRLIEVSESNSFSNMAIDEFLLDRYIKNPEALPVLRFYSWERPTVSLGRSQTFDEINLDFCQKNNLKVVKRPTGGKAVLHQGEFTYSIIASSKDGFSPSIKESYMQISRALIFSLKECFPELNAEIAEDTSTEYRKEKFCFEKSTVSDINISGKKLIGSSQLRKGDFFLQHGSILINQDFELIKSIFPYELNLSLVNLADVVGYIPDYKIIKNCILQGFRKFFRIEFIYDSLQS
jgi:lipoate-protein ligase A